MTGKTKPESAGLSASESRPLAPSRRAKLLIALVLVLLYLAAVLPRLRVAGFDEPDLTYGDERMTIGQAEALLRDPKARIEHFHKGPGAPHFLYLSFKAYYWLVRDRYGWESVDDVQWWRVRRFWRSLNIILSSLTIILVGVIGAGAFNWRVGLVAAALMAASRMCAIWVTFMKEDGIMMLWSGIVVYAAYRILIKSGLRFGWLVLGGIATGGALVFKHNSMTTFLFFIVVIFLADLPARKRGVWAGRFSRFRFPQVLVYVLATLMTVAAWFPQLIFRTSDVWKSVISQPQTTALDVRQLKLPPIRRLLDVGWNTWNMSFHTRAGLTDTYPDYFFILMTAILVAAPFYALLRRDRLLLSLSFFVWLMFAVVWEQWLFSGWKFSHYFMPAFVAIYLLVAFGIDWIAGLVTRGLKRLAPSRTGLIQAILALALIAWPCFHAYSTSLKFLSWLRGGLGSLQERNESLRQVVRAVPAGSRVFVPMAWLNMRVTDKLFDNRIHASWRRDIWSKYKTADLVRQGYDYACIENYVPGRPVGDLVYARQLAEKKVEPIYTQPVISHFTGKFSYVPIQPPNGKSFNLGLYFREPDAGDFGGVQGIVPSAGKADDPATQSFILKARLTNEINWIAGFLRWDVAVNGTTLWQGREATSTTHANLALPFQARPGAEILVRTIRTDFRPEATWSWGSRLSDLKVDGLELIDPATSKSLSVDWKIVGRNGGAEPEYAMRRDWASGEAATPLLDPGFEGDQPLVDAWRAHRVIEPKGYDKFPDQWRCRKEATIEKAPGAGVGGDNAILISVAYPPKESSRLGIMQPAAHPAAQTMQKLRFQYRTVPGAKQEGEVVLRIVASGFGLSGEYVDRATAETALTPGGDQWRTLELDLRKAWKSRHARVDLIEFLEVNIELAGGAGAVYSCLIDNVEWE